MWNWIVAFFARLGLAKLEEKNANQLSVVKTYCWLRDGLIEVTYSDGTVGLFQAYVSSMENRIRGVRTWSLKTATHLQIFAMNGQLGRYSSPEEYKVTFQHESITVAQAEEYFDVVSKYFDELFLRTKPAKRSPEINLGWALFRASNVTLESLQRLQKQS